MTPEGKIKNKVDKLLKKFGVWYFCPNAGQFGQHGIPDRIAIINARFIGIECKSNKTKRLTKLQEKTGREIEQAGGKFFVVCDDESLGEVREYLEERAAFR